MSSIDDTILTRMNLLLLDNVTNLNKPAIDYFTFPINTIDKIISMLNGWSLLLKMRKFDLLRLPSCSITDMTNYKNYLVRLHHVMWRRSTIEFYHLQNLKIHPLMINWDKDFDFNILYGPNFFINTYPKSLIFIDSDTSDNNLSTAKRIKKIRFNNIVKDIEIDIKNRFYKEKLKLINDMPQALNYYLVNHRSATPNLHYLKNDLITT